MACRFTDTLKWGDSWFVELTKNQKLLFLYLCDNCDIAGFFEVAPKKICIELDFTMADFKGAFKGLERGLIWSADGSVVYLRTFLKNQKNLPLNEANKAHKGILSRFQKYAPKFDLFLLSDTLQIDFFELLHLNSSTYRQAPSKGLGRGLEGAWKGLPRGYGNGIDNNIQKEIYNSDSIQEKEKEKNWKTDYDIYLNSLRTAWVEILKDSDWLSDKERFYPKVDIKLSLEKGCKEYWATDAGWKNKKRSRSNTIDWRATFDNLLSNKQNRVYKTDNSNDRKRDNFSVGDTNKRVSTI